MKKISFRAVNKRAFTLIELLVVIAIIALLTGIVMTNLTSSRAKARDAKRISDLGQLQLALELFFDRCKQYPLPDHGDARYAINVNYQCPTNAAVHMSDYIAQIPTPPSPSYATYYEYTTNYAQTDFILETKLEYPSELLRDSFKGHPGWYDGGYDVPGGNKGYISAYCDSLQFYCLSPK